MKNTALAAKIANGGNGHAQPQGAPAGMEMAPVAPRGMDTSSAAHSSAAQMQARIQARTLMAFHNPRDMDRVRVSLLRECRRPSFAKVAMYKKPIGGGFIEGPSIRFIEAALRIFGNADSEAPVIYEDAELRIVRMFVVDLETNTGHSTDIPIQKTVERNSVDPSREVLATRTNKQGKPVYIVRATEDEMLVKTGSLVSKALRTNGQRLIPGDVVDECMRVVRETNANEDAVDPDAMRKAVTADFAEFGVEPDDLRAYLGHELNAFTKEERADLHAIYTAISEGETTWHAVMEQRERDRASGATPQAQKAEGNGKAAKPPSDDEGQAQQRAPLSVEEAARKVAGGTKLKIEQKRRLFDKLKGLDPGTCALNDDALRAELPKAAAAWAAEGHSIEDFSDLVDEVRS